MQIFVGNIHAPLAGVDLFLGVHQACDVEKLAVIIHQVGIESGKGAEGIVGNQHIVLERYQVGHGDLALTHQRHTQHKYENVDHGT